MIERAGAALVASVPKHRQQQPGGGEAANRKARRGSSSEAMPTLDQQHQRDRFVAGDRDEHQRRGEDIGDQRQAGGRRRAGWRTRSVATRQQEQRDDEVGAGDGLAEQRVRDL